MAKGYATYSSTMQAHHNEVAMYHGEENHVICICKHLDWVWESKTDTGIWQQDSLVSWEYGSGLARIWHVPFRKPYTSEQTAYVFYAFNETQN